VHAIQDRAYQMGYDILLAQTQDIPEREEACIQRFLSRRVDGVLISPAYRMAAEPRVYQELADRAIPVVLIGHTAPFCNQFVNVEADDLGGSYTETQHLLKLGHKRIAFFTGPQSAPWSQERLEGYRRALREADIEVDDKLIFDAGRTIEDGAKAALQMINESVDATAIQAVNDIVAVGCAQAILKQGLKIPDDISIAGFGNILLSEYFRVPLTTVNQPKLRLGVAAIEAMQQFLLGKRPESKRLPAELVVRSSTGIASATSPLKRLKTQTNIETTL
jgi:DNA-binding LacI/PurR family transcriptional regulator